MVTSLALPPTQVRSASARQNTRLPRNAHKHASRARESKFAAGRFAQRTQRHEQRTMADPKANPLMFSGNAADMLKQYGQAVPVCA